MCWILETPRLRLRRMTDDDFPSLCAMLCDDRVMYAYEGAFSEEEARAWLQKQQARYALDGTGLWAVCRKGDDALIGQCGLTWQDVQDGTQGLEVGYLFCASAWGQGYATEAAQACRDYAFRELGAREVYSIIRDTNEASQRVACRNGMEPVGICVKHYRGVTMPHIIFCVRRPDASL